MKDILVEKIETEVKLVALQLMQQYYAGRMDYKEYTDLLSGVMTNKKKLVTLVSDTADLTLRRKVQDKPYPFSYYCDKCMEKEED